MNKWTNPVPVGRPLHLHELGHPDGASKDPAQATDPYYNPYTPGGMFPPLNFPALDLSALEDLINSFNDGTICPDNSNSNTASVTCATFIPVKDFYFDSANTNSHSFNYSNPSSSATVAFLSILLNTFGDDQPTVSGWTHIEGGNSFFNTEEFHVFWKDIGGEDHITGTIEVSQDVSNTGSRVLNGIWAAAGIDNVAPIVQSNFAEGATNSALTVPLAGYSDSNNIGFTVAAQSYSDRSLGWVEGWVSIAAPTSFNSSIGSYTGMFPRAAYQVDGGSPTWGPVVDNSSSTVAVAVELSVANV